MTTSSDSKTTTTDFDVRSLFDGRVLATPPSHTPGQVAFLAEQLRREQPAWEELGPAGRCRHLIAWVDWIMDNERRIVELIQAESGKPWGDEAFEPAVAIDVVNYVAKNAATWLADQRINPHSIPNAGKRLAIFARRYPLVGVILPWNVPLGMPMLEIPYALAAVCLGSCDRPHLEQSSQCGDQGE